ncbi:hypothetical protein U1Q18_000160 [Sarracenia purpurea var. burkii]
MRRKPSSSPAVSTPDFPPLNFRPYNRRMSLLTACTEIAGTAPPIDNQKPALLNTVIPSCAEISSRRRPDLVCRFWLLSKTQKLPFGFVLPTDHRMSLTVYPSPQIPTRRNRGNLIHVPIFSLSAEQRLQLPCSFCAPETLRKLPPTPVKTTFGARASRRSPPRSKIKTFFLPTTSLAACNKPRRHPNPWADVETLDSPFLCQTKNIFDKSKKY